MHNGSPRASIKSRHDGFQESWGGKLGAGAGLERGEITVGRGCLPPQPPPGRSGEGSEEGLAGLRSHTRQSWSLSSTLGKASPLSDHRLLFCETGNAVSLTVWQLQEMMHVTNRHRVA